MCQRGEKTNHIESSGLKEYHAHSHLSIGGGKRAIFINLIVIHERPSSGASKHVSWILRSFCAINISLKIFIIMQTGSLTQSEDVEEFLSPSLSLLLVVFKKNQMQNQMSRIF